MSTVKIIDSTRHFYAAMGNRIQEFRKCIIPAYYANQTCFMWNYNNCIPLASISATNILSHSLDLPRNAYYSPENIEKNYSYSEIRYIHLHLFKCKMTQALTKIPIGPHYWHTRRNDWSKHFFQICAPILKSCIKNMNNEASYTRNYFSERLFFWLLALTGVKFLNEFNSHLNI
jgi:hypothetical protein